MRTDEFLMRIPYNLGQHAVYVVCNKHIKSS